MSSVTLKDVMLEPGVRVHGENVKVYGNFARAVIAEREGDHGKAAELLDKAVAADIEDRKL